MSAFIVSSLCVNRVLRGLRALDTKFYETDLMEMDQIKQLGQKILEMNARAVQARYGDNQDPGLFEFEILSNVSKVQSYKSLQCLLYQCTEGSVPDEQLFQRPEAHENRLARHIVNSLPEYETAEWG